MRAFDFTLKYRLEDAGENPEQHLDSLAQTGCNDAVVGIGQNGCIALNFVREAGSAYDAITSAIADVYKAIPEAKLVEAKPDFVGVTDMANLFGHSRQYMRQFIQKKGAAFPEPIHQGKPSLWHLKDVLVWFRSHDSSRVPSDLLEVAEINMQLNVSMSCARVSTLLGLHKGKIQIINNDCFSTEESWDSFAEVQK